MNYSTYKRAISVLMTLYVPLASLHAEINICYFSLNNEKEFTKMQEFTANLDQAEMEKIVVTEYQKEGSDPATHLKK